MNKYPLIGKCLAVGIILLFVGMTIAPTININTVKASTDDDLVEVTTQACGIQGYGDTTVKLTREQYQNLEQYLVEFRARLNQTSTREEAVPIFKEAVVVLNRYRLLPKGLSVEQAQRLVVGPYLNKNGIKLINIKNIYLIGNYFCNVVGKSTLTYFQCIFPFSILNFLFWNAFAVKPVSILNSVGFGYPGGFESSQSPAVGYIRTFGHLGLTNWSGKFFGGFDKNFMLVTSIWGGLTVPGIIGFTGLKTYISEDYYSYFGYAIMVKIDPYPY